MSVVSHFVALSVSLSARLVEILNRIVLMHALHINALNEDAACMSDQLVVRIFQENVARNPESGNELIMADNQMAKSAMCLEGDGLKTRTDIEQYRNIACATLTAYIGREHIMNRLKASPRADSYNSDTGLVMAACYGRPRLSDYCQIMGQMSIFATSILEALCTWLHSGMTNRPRGFFHSMGPMLKQEEVSLYCTPDGGLQGLRESSPAIIEPGCRY